MLPVLFEGHVKAVLELSSFEQFSPTHQAFLDQLVESIGIVLNTIEANSRTEDLLKQSQSLAQELPKSMAAVPLNPGIINTEMLQSCFGGSAGSYPNPDEWAERAVPFLLNLSAKDNGRSLSAP